MQANGETVSYFKHLAKENVSQWYTTQKDFSTSSNRPKAYPGYPSYVFDFSYHQDFGSAEPIKIGFHFGAAVPAATSKFGYALLVTTN